MPKLHGARVLSGLGRAVLSHAMSRSPWPQRRESRVGRCLHKIADSRNGFWISAIDLSKGVRREFRKKQLQMMIKLNRKLYFIRSKNVSRVMIELLLNSTLPHSVMPGINGQSTSRSDCYPVELLPAPLNNVTSSSSSSSASIFSARLHCHSTVKKE